MSVVLAREYRVAILGAGAWGVALARAASRATPGSVLLASRRDAPAIEGVNFSRGDVSATARARLIVLAVPSAHVAAVADELEPHIDGSHYVVHGVRGLVGDELKTVSDVIRERTPARRIGAIGGPVLASELAEGGRAVMVVGSRYPEVCAAFRDAFAQPSLRVYATTDLTGLEWASTLTGGLAIALGYAAGAGASPGLVAAFTTRAVHEAARLAVAAGGTHDTLLGLAGLGDLLAATGQTDRPEVVFGRALARGASPAEAAREAGARIEALELLPRLVRWADARRVRSPIIHGLEALLSGRRSREDAIETLMQGPIVDDLLRRPSTTKAPSSTIFYAAPARRRPPRRRSFTSPQHECGKASLCLQIGG